MYFELNNSIQVLISPQSSDEKFIKRYCIFFLLFLNCTNEEGGKFEIIKAGT